ncbi:MAG: DMT family transporter, partial [Actinomycetia bacterium]|nr:DMT family transporter [Actinomycetes bacterium]
PLFTLAAGVLIFKQKLHVQTVLGACGALLGCAIAVGAFSEGGLSISPRGLMWGITSAFFFALYTVMGSRAGSRFEPFGLQFYGMVCASIMWLVVLGPAPILAVFADLRTALMLIVISITSTTLAFGLYLNAMRLISATHAAITAMAEPIIAGIIAALFLGERMTLSLIMGGALVIGSIILIQVSGSDAPV